MARKLNVVVFLGAGFSQPFDLPVMNEFFARARDTDAISDEDKRFLEELQRDAQAGASMLDETHINLEHVLSWALMRTLGREDETPPIDQLKAILQRVYSSINFESYPQLHGKLGELLGRKRKGTPDYDLTIITTNYDLMAEFALRGIGMKSRLPFGWQPIERNNRGDPLYVQDRPGPLLCKLHGSLNWFVSGNDEIEIKIESDVVRIEGPDPFKPQRQEWVLPRSCARGYFDEHSPAPPLIVPPTLYKQEAGEQFELIWAAAHKAIRHADRLVFVGYSFPKSDTHMKYFLASALLGNIGLERIDILDPQANSIVERLNDTNMGTAFKHFLTPQQFQWHISKYDLFRK